MFSAAKMHVLYKVLNAPVRQFPFPHVYIEEIFPPAFYAELQRNMIEDAAYTRLADTGRVNSDYSGARYSLFPQELDDRPIPDEKKTFWKNIFTTFNDGEFGGTWISVFQQTVMEKFRQLPPELTGGRQPGQTPLTSEIFLLRDRTSYSLGPHTDSMRKVVSVLFYLPPDDSQASLGTSAYIPKDRSFTCPGGPHHPFELFDLVATMPYRPNCLVAFPQSPRSFHGVEPVLQEGAVRDLLLFDVKLKNFTSPAA